MYIYDEEAIKKLLEQESATESASAVEWKNDDYSRKKRYAAKRDELLSARKDAYAEDKLRRGEGPVREHRPYNDLSGMSSLEKKEYYRKYRQDRYDAKRRAEDPDYVPARDRVKVAPEVEDEVAATEPEVVMTPEEKAEARRQYQREYQKRRYAEKKAARIAENPDDAPKRGRPSIKNGDIPASSRKAPIIANIGDDVADVFTNSSLAQLGKSMKTAITSNVREVSIDCGTAESGSPELDIILRPSNGTDVGIDRIQSQLAASYSKYRTQLDDYANQGVETYLWLKTPDGNDFITDGIEYVPGEGFKLDVLTGNGSTSAKESVGKRSKRLRKATEGFEEKFPRSSRNAFNSKVMGGVFGSYAAFLDYWDDSLPPEDFGPSDVDLIVRQFNRCLLYNVRCGHIICGNAGECGWISYDTDECSGMVKISMQAADGSPEGIEILKSQTLNALKRLPAAHWVDDLGMRVVIEIQYDEDAEVGLDFLDSYGAETHDYNPATGTLE